MRASFSPGGRSSSPDGDGRKLGWSGWPIALGHKALCDLILSFSKDEVAARSTVKSAIPHGEFVEPRQTQNADFREKPASMSKHGSYCGSDDGA